VLLVVGLVFVMTAIFLATQSTVQQSRHQPNPLIFAGVGALLVVEAAVLLFRAKATVTPVAPEYGLGRSSGPFGLDGPRALDVTKVYRLNHGFVTIAWTGVTVVFVSIGTALWIRSSVLSGIIGGAIGVALAAYIALALQRSSLEVGPRGITLNGVGTRKSIPWADVESVGVQNGRCIVRVRNTATSRNPGGTRTRDFSAYLRAKDNASMPGLIALYRNQRAAAPPPFGASPGPWPVGVEPAPPSFGASPAPWPLSVDPAPLPFASGPAAWPVSASLDPPPLTPSLAPPWSAFPASASMSANPPPPPMSAGQVRLMHLRAGFGIRLAAWSIDVVATAAIGFVVAVVIDTVLAGIHNGIVPTADGTPAVYAGFGLTLVVYPIVCWHRGATLGMWILRLRVIDSANGLPPSWGRSLVRFAAALPSIVFFIPFGLISVLGYDRLALHDRPARTLVVSISNKGLPVADSGAPPST
jgi:uncharacterized RDD family membrane protein YckC